MNLYIKKILFLAIFILPNAVFAIPKKNLSLLDIYKLRSQKCAKSRLFNGKKVLLKRLKKNHYLADITTDIANRLGCDPEMKESVKKALGKKSWKKNFLVNAAYEAKNREN